MMKDRSQMQWSGPFYVVLSEAAGFHPQIMWKCRRAASTAASIAGGTCGGSTPSGSGRLWPPWVTTPCFRLTWVTCQEAAFRPYSCNTQSLISR